MLGFVMMTRWSPWLNSMSFRTMESSVVDPDSEARTFYVGVTRAKKTLDIVYGENPAECLQ